MMFRAIVTISFVILTSCGNLDEPSISKLASVTALTNHTIEVISYEIPKGIFRGALWPHKGKGFFVIWIVNDGKESFFELKAPQEFVNYEKEVTSDWEFKIIEQSDSSKKYLVRKKDRSKSIYVKLPIKKRNFSFYVLINSSGDEIVIFMDISDKIVDTGLFGYVTITDRT